MIIREILSKMRHDFRALEPLLVDGFATISPWLSAVFPAALTGWNVAHYLTHDWGLLQYPVAILCAAAVESLGISATHTAIKEWAKGRHTSAGLFRLAIASGLHYLAAVIAVNVVLEAAYSGDWPRIVAKAILSTMTVTGALVIAIRAQGAENDIARDEKKAEKRSDKTAKLSPVANENGDNSRDNSHDNSQPSGDNSRPDRAAWVADYMKKNNVSQATAYRHYAAQFKPKGK